MKSEQLTITPLHDSPAIEALEPLEVMVIRSKKRRKSAQARMRDGLLEVRLPAQLSEKEGAKIVTGFVERFERSRRSELVDLDVRAASLADTHGLHTPASIRWVSNQLFRWGSCTPSTGEIRISDRMARFPLWVIDYVIVHELAHLEVSAHNDEFHAIVGRYELAERARGYLQAKSED